MADMKRLGMFKDAREKAFADVEKLIGTISLTIKPRPTRLDEGISCLRQLRKSIYENLNQIQHECMAIDAAEWLIDNQHASNKTEWYWNPRQTGDDKQPDLRGMIGQRVVISAELTTSEKPSGVIDTRMRNTLTKLSKMEGNRFYFVRTESMCKRAFTKCDGLKLTRRVTVALLPLP